MYESPPVFALKVDEVLMFAGGGQDKAASVEKDGGADSERNLEQALTLTLSPNSLSAGVLEEKVSGVVHGGAESERNSAAARPVDPGEFTPHLHNIMGAQMLQRYHK
jgi:hypothetical protein